VWLLPRLTSSRPVAYCEPIDTVVSDDDLRRLSGSSTTRVVFAAMPAVERGLSDWLRDLPPGPRWRSA
jgi:hypothetical protein